MTNASVIMGQLAGVDLTAGGSVDAAADSTITATGTSGIGVVIVAAAGTVGAYAATISGVKDSVLLAEGGTVFATSLTAACVWPGATDAVLAM